MIGRVLPLAIFFSAAASLAVELAIVRLGAPYVGQALLPWSAAIASVLLGLSVGHMLGGIVAGSTTDVRKLKTWLALVWFSAAIAASVMPAVVGLVVRTFPGEQEPGAGAVLAIAGLAFPPSLAVGFVAPLAVRLIVLTPQMAVSRTVGAIYAASAAGSVAGTVAAGFVLLEAVGATGLIGFVCAIWIALGILALSWNEKPDRRTIIGIAVIGGTAGIAVLLTIVHAGPGPCFRETRYTCIRLLDQPLADGGLVRFMLLDEGVHSASDRDHPQRLHLGYAALTDRLARAVLLNSAAGRALVIGGGGATLPRAWAASAPPTVIDVTSIELDPVVAAVANDKMWVDGPGRRVTTLVGDGRAVVRGMPGTETFDVILMDAYRTHSVPPHLATREFAALIAARVSPHGVYLTNVIDRTATPSLALSIATTLSELFPAVDIWAVGGEQENTTNYVVAAWKNHASAYRPDAESVTASVMNAGEAVRAQALTWRRVDIAAAATVWPDACAVVLTDDWAPVDRLIAGRRVCGRPPAR